MKNYQFNLRRRPGVWTTGVVLWLSTWLAWGTLTATVSPGYTFGVNEIPSIATLNELGEPTVIITGTVDGTTGLTPGSVTGTLLADSVVDGITITYNGSSPRAIQVAQEGISTNQVNPLLFYAGITGGNGGPVSLVVDTNFFALSTNSIDSTSTNGASVTNGVYMVPMLTLLPGALTDTNISGNAQEQVTKLQHLGTNAMLVSTPGNTNVPATIGNPFVLNSFTSFMTNFGTNVVVIGTNLENQPIFATNYTTNVLSSTAWTFNLLQVQTNISLPKATAQFIIPHFFGADPVVVRGYLEVLGTNVITTNVVTGISTNYTTNAPNITPLYTGGGSALDWNAVQFITNNNSGSAAAPGNFTAIQPVFTWTVDTNYLYITQAPSWQSTKNGVSGNLQTGWGYVSNSAVGPWGVIIPATNWVLSVTVRY